MPRQQSARCSKTQNTPQCNGLYGHYSSRGMERGRAILIKQRQSLWGGGHDVLLLQ